MKKAFQSKVLARFMTEKQLANLEQEYNDNKITRGGRTRKVTSQDFAVLSDYLKETSVRPVARKFRISPARVYTSIRLAALAKLQEA